MKRVGGEISYRLAGVEDVAAMTACRVPDRTAGPADARMGAYFAGRHHPREALRPRIGFVATVDDAIIGYIAGHLSERFGCQGEIQYLYVSPARRRRGVARTLVERLAEWFANEGVARVCVNVDVESPGAREFYLSMAATDLRPFWMEWRDIRASIAAQPGRHADEEL